MKRRKFIKDLSLSTSFALSPLISLGSKPKENSMFFEIGLAEWSLNKAIDKGEITNMDFPSIAKNDYGINIIEYVNQFFMDKATNKNARDAYDTLYTVLNILLKFSAPLIPLVSEKLYMNLNNGDSVHLQNWPELDEFILDEELISNMDKVRKIVSSALSIRKKNKIRVRQPLNLLKINIDKNE